MVKTIKKHSTMCTITVTDSKQTYIAENHIRFQGHIPVSPVAVYHHG
jgi:hypothetical protein